MQNRLEKFQNELKKINEKNQNDENLSNKNLQIKDFLPDETNFQPDDDLERKNLFGLEKAIKETKFKLMNDEAKHLQELILLADKVKEETRIKK